MVVALPRGYMPDQWMVGVGADLSDVVGRMLRELRAAKGRALGREVSQREVGQALGISQTVYGRWEQGSQAPSAEALVALEQYFELPPLTFERAQNEARSRLLDVSVRPGVLPSEAVAIPAREPVVRMLAHALSHEDAELAAITDAEWQAFFANAVRFTQPKANYRDAVVEECDESKGEEQRRA